MVERLKRWNFNLVEADKIERQLSSMKGEEPLKVNESDSATSFNSDGFESSSLSESETDREDEPIKEIWKGKTLVKKKILHDSAF